MDVGWLDKRLGEQQQREPEAAQAMRDTMRHKCQNMGRLIESAVDNVGRIITDLRPSILDHQGLWAALDWQAHEFVQSAELALDWQMDVAGAAPLPEPWVHRHLPHLPGNAQQRGPACRRQRGRHPHPRRCGRHQHRGAGQRPRRRSRRL